MNDLELCKAFAELEGVELMTVCKVAGGPVIRYDSLLTLEPYNPITDLALCFEAVIKYGVKINPDDKEVCIRTHTSQSLVDYIASKEIPRAVIECIVKHVNQGAKIL